MLRRLLCAASSAGALQQRLRVATFNIHAWRDSSHEDNLERVVACLEGLEADVVCLNEVLHPYALDEMYDDARGRGAYLSAVRDGRMRGARVGTRQMTSSYLERLADRAGAVDYRFAEAERDLSFFGAVPFGSAILSKEPIEASEKIFMPSTPEDTQLGDQERDVVESRGGLWARIRLDDGRPLTVATTHLDHKSEELRAKQMATCLAALPSDNGSLLCGDLNTFCREDHSDDAWQRLVAFYVSKGWTAPKENSLVLDMLRNNGYRDAAHDISLRDKKEGQKPLPTCWTHNPLFKIDHLWLSADLDTTVAAYERLDTDASDHFPIYVDLDFFHTSTKEL